MEAYRIERNIIGKHESLWFCANCCRRKSSNDGSSPLWQARCCRALIRYLATQWYGRTLWFEELSIDQLKEHGDPGRFHDKCISLARLDLMMDGVLHKFGYSESNKESTYYGFMVASERLTWAPESIENEPLKLLCMGVQRLVDRIGDSAVKEAFLTDFCILFCAWCLSQCHLDEDMVTDGPYLHALHAGRPFQQDALCQRCLLRGIPQRDSRSFCVTCDELWNLRKEETETEPTVEAVSVAERKMRAYEQGASLVGKVVLLLPSHELMSQLTAELKRFNIIVEHHDRPLELLVASFIPRDICQPEDSETGGEIGGVYHLLPLVNFEQVDFLVKQSRPRTVEGSLSDELMDRWSKDGLLDLSGVLQMSYAEVFALVSATNAIFEAAKKEVYRQTQCWCPVLQESNSHLSVIDGEQHNPFICFNANCSTLQSFGDLAHCRTVNERVLLLEDFSFSCNPIFTAMLRHNGFSVDSSAENSPHEVHGHIAPAKREDEDVVPEAFFATITPTAIKHRDFAVVYSDLFFRFRRDRDSFVEMNDLAKTLPPLHHGPILHIVMSRKQKIDFPELNGWGFELNRWTRDKVLTVGRIDPSGPAFFAGLRSGDRIVELNGLPVDLLDSPISLGCVLLGVPFVTNVAHSARDRMAAGLLKQSVMHGLERCVLRAKIIKFRGTAPTVQPQHTVQQSKTSPLSPLPQPRRTLPQPSTEVIDLVSDHVTEASGIKALVPSDSDVLLTIGKGQKIQLARKIPLIYRDYFRKVPVQLTVRSGALRAVVEKIHAQIEKSGRFLITQKVQSQFAQSTWRLASNAEALCVIGDVVCRIVKQLSEQEQLKQAQQLQRPVSPPVQQLPSIEQQPKSPPVQQPPVQQLPPVQQPPVQQLPPRPVLAPPTLTDTEMAPLITAILSLPRFGRSPELNHQDLDRQGPKPLVLTIAEASLLVTSIAKGQVLLGMRLLVPRYDVDFLVEQVRDLSQVDVGNLKVLPYQAWELFQRLDYHRSQLEPPDAPNFFIEARQGDVK